MLGLPCLTLRTCSVTQLRIVCKLLSTPEDEMHNDNSYAELRPSLLRFCMAVISTGPLWFTGPYFGRQWPTDFKSLGL